MSIQEYSSKSRTGKAIAIILGAEAMRTAVLTLTSVQILALFATPVTVIGAPLAGFAVIVESILFEMNATATQYASGGVVTFQYSGGAVVHASSIPAAVINAAAGQTVTALVPTTSAITVSPATAVTVSNATGAFTTGTGTAKIYVRYRLITL